MYTVKLTNEFKKGLKRCKKRGLDISKVETAIKILRDTGSLPDEYRPHKLSGNRDGQWECHIQPDWLMVWIQDNNELVLLILATGSHSDIF